MPTSPLNVPHVQDEQLQHFFNEVANQLNTMNIRSSVASGSSTSTANALGSDYHAYMAFANGPNSRPVSPVMEAGEMEETVDQFADADDDDTEIASVYSHGPSSSIGHAPPSPLVGLGFGQPPVQARPGLYPVPAQSANGSYNNRWSYASSTGSSRHPAESPQLYSQHPWSSPQPELAPVFQAQRTAPAPPPRQASRPAPPPPRPVSAVSTHNESLLPRDGSYVMIDNADVPVSDSSWGSKQSGFSAHRNAQDAFGRLKKRNKKAVTIDPVPYSAELAGPSTGTSMFSAMSAASTVASTSSPKRSWFNNLFSFKPASCTLLCRDNIGNTRERTKRVLHTLGVQVAVVEIDGLRALKCRLDEVKDLQGTSTVVKGVRFKVEFSRSNASSSGSYNTLVSLTQEKGAQSTFKTIFTSLKSHLESDVPIAPVPASPISAHSTPAASVSRPARPLPPVQTPSYGFGAYPHSPGQPRSTPNTLSAPPMQHVRWTNSAPNSPNLPSTPRFAPSPQMPNPAHLSSPIRM
jgi:hypothetical protein